eukprot:gnl/MRDRNA2_/MRDRNA2_30214_c0_seq1.p1 gnl/MRDRNA2_/MRDRNA2_30214_c0~~gnl/MRDRNA2_/MRDRNA2_30214_c0_seq1.p1  ORF type:complete len:106 (+),score=38.69 gnl/MRDRNA2_/MRDRNA2_30214_c0_seq1:90-407(+)
MARFSLLFFVVAVSYNGLPAAGGRGLRRFQSMSLKDISMKILEDPPKEEEKKKDEPWHADLGKGEKADHNIDEEPGQRNKDRNKTVEENVTKAQDPAANPDFGAR